MTNFGFALILLALLGALLLAAFACILALDKVRAPTRDYKDPVPLVWRGIWPCVEAIAFWIKPRLSVGAIEASRHRLQKIGWSFWIDPSQFIALRIVCALGVGTVATLSLGSLNVSAVYGVLGLAIGWYLPWTYVSERIETRRLLALRQLPFYIDLLTLGVEGGQPLSVALAMVVQHGAPGALRDELQRVQRELRTGKPRHQCLEAMAERMDLPEVTNLVTTLNMAERQGMQLGPLLRSQAETRRNERFLRAEKLAMQAPVKMLFPLVACIFPGTFAIILFPIASQLLSTGFLK